jgi:hypothetical protein
MPAPVAIFCYNRPDCLQKCVAQLAKNPLAASTPLYFFSDAAKTASDVKQVQQVRSYLKAVTGFEHIVIIEAPRNKGLARSIIDGVTSILNKFEEVIVLEDDLITTENFLDFMNACLNFYRLNSKVFSISGFTMPINMEQEFQHDVYFTKRASSWGWATWRNRWTDIDWEVKDYRTFAANREARRKFNLMGSDLSGMLDKQMKGKINSWAIRWCYHQFKTETFTVFPCTSKVENIGFVASASHTSPIQSGRFKTELDKSLRRQFDLNHQVELNSGIIMQFTRPYSLRTRLKYKLMGFFPKVISAH